MNRLLSWLRTDIFSGADRQDLRCRAVPANSDRAGRCDDSSDAASPVAEKANGSFGMDIENLNTAEAARVFRKTDLRNYFTGSISLGRQLLSKKDSSGL
jgi:hypothetical protein